MKLQSRLALTVASAAAIAIFVMASAFWVLGARQQRDSVDESLLAVARQPREIVADLELPDRPARRPGLGFGGLFGDLSNADDRVFTRVRVTNAEGEVIIDQGLPAVDAPAEPSVSTIEIDGERFRMATARLGVNGDLGIVQIARNVEDIEAGLTRLRREIILGGLLGVALAGFLGALVARRLTAPIIEVSTAAREMGLRQDLPSRINVDRTDEVGDLARSFNQMLSALEVSRDQQRRLVADASHELRTPLTSLRLKIDLLDKTPQLPEAQRQEFLSDAAAELERLTTLVAELVSLATDPTNIDEQPTSVVLSSLVGEVTENVRRSSGRTIEVRELAGGSFDVRGAMVRRAVTNVLSNAVKYSEEDTPIVVTVDGPRIEVRDQGSGIPDADLPHIFDRFFRSPEARTRPGNGIGLAIVQRVAELHGGEIWARNATDGPGAVVGFSVG